MPHAIWRGAISFGLVTVPVSLHGAERKSDLAFRQLDSRDGAPIGQKRVNTNTGEEVPWEEVAKGYELPDGRMVIVNDDDFRSADVEATQTIEILAFVDGASIGVEYFSRPYLLEPMKQGRKAYALLREVLTRTERVGIAKVVIRTRQHLAALLPQGDTLILELLRWPHELRSAEGLEIPASGEESFTDAELKMATTLVEAMEGAWTPDAYADTYRENLLALIEQKAESGEATPLPAPPAYEPGAEVVDIMTLLKESVEKATRKAAG
ncbi:MAG: non-homologous end joining protein Ku [Coriobacteriia bacterium]